MADGISQWVLDDRINVVNKNINAVKAEVLAVGAAVVKTDRHVDAIEKQISNLKNDVDVLQKTLYGLIEQSERQHNIQVAEERIVKIRQEIERQFGNYEKIRRTTVGILQTVDLGIVKKDTVNFVSDEFMITTPNYWLAPCLVALSAWVNNEKEIAETAIKEALHRSEEKTSLLFALICRRAGRKNACYQWTLRYLAIQNPENLDMKCIFVLDAFANGLLGSDSEGSVFKYMNEWVDKLSEKGDFEQKQIENWGKIVNEQKRISDDFRCNLNAVHKYCTNSGLISEKSSLACLHKNLYNYVDSIMSTKIDSERIEDKLDDVLLDMVKDFDDDERESRYEERLNNFIIKYDGDKDRAEAEARIERSEFEAEKDFTEILSEAALGTKSQFTSASTQKFSLAFCRDWLKSAYMDVMARGRMATSRLLSFAIDDFTFETNDGRNEKLVLEDLREQLDKQKNSDINSLRTEYMEVQGAAKKNIIIGSIVAGVCLLFALGGNAIFWIGAIIGGIIGIRGAINYKNVEPEFENAQRQLSAKYENKYNDTSASIRQICAEMVRFDKLLTEKNREETATAKLIESLSPEMYIRQYDGAKNVRIKI